jgi:hypothetical protein
MHGVKIKHPTYLKKSTCQNLVICSTNHSDDIKESLLDLNVRKEISVIVFK